VLDFFAGSGTTMNAVNLLNASDKGHRQCVLVTNNEVSESEAKRLSEIGVNTGHDEWESNGICRSVTFPRNKYTILGKRDDGSELEGVYLTGRMLTKEKPRAFKQLGFTEGHLLTIAQRKQLVGLLDKIPQSKITAEMPFFWFIRLTSTSVYGGGRDGV
jgi:adenine-specific DNA-methyltransferase